MGKISECCGYPIAGEPLDDVAVCSKCHEWMPFYEEKVYSISKHGNGYALYKGRSVKFHGLNLCFLSDFDSNGEATRKLIEDALNAYDI